MPDRIKAIIFDADGMVITGERPSTRLARDFGVPIEKINQFFDNEFKDCILGKSDLKEVVKPYLSKWNWKGTIDDLLHFWFAESYRIDEQMVAEIENLKAKGIKCFLATNQEKYRVNYMKNQMGLGKVFDRIFSSAEIGAKKATNEFLDTITDSLPKVKKEEILFYDDRQENIDFAQTYGFQTMLYKSREDLSNIDI